MILLEVPAAKDDSFLEQYQKGNPGKNIIH
jgi:hypothetical protein